MNNLNTTTPIKDEKPFAVIDNSLLQGICKLPTEKSDVLIQILKEKYRVVATPTLVEEIIVSFYERDATEKPALQKMLKAIQEMLLFEEPLELIFREFILGENIRANFQLNSHMAKMLGDVVGNPDSLSAEAPQWIIERRQEKTERLQARTEYQCLMKEKNDEASRIFPNHAAFMERVIFQLGVEIDGSSELKICRLNRYLGSFIKRRHPDCEELTQKAFIEATFDELDKTRFTRNYLLTELLYDWAVICKVTNEFNQPIKILDDKKQINDEDDQQYVASALVCSRLLTCDKGMSSIAGFFSERKLWAGKPVYIPRDKIEKFENLEELEHYLV